MAISPDQLKSSTPASPKPSTDFADSEATTPPDSSPDQPAPSLPSPSTTSTPTRGGSAIQYEHRIFVTGNTRSGKSTLIRSLFLSAAAPRCVVDPADSNLTAIPGAVTFSDPRRVPKDAATIRFVPRDPADRDAYDQLYRWLFHNFPRTVWLDEPDQAAPASGWPRWVNTYQVQGAKRMLGHMVCATRPRNVMKSLIALAHHVFVFELPNPDDVKYLADLIGLPAAVLQRELQALPRFGFLWWNGVDRVLTVCPPIRPAA